MEGVGTMSAFLRPQYKVRPQFKEYCTYLKNRIHYKAGTAAFLAKQMQDYVYSGLTPKQYYHKVNQSDKRAAETFLLNFRNYNQFITEQYFNDLDELCWELLQNHERGKQVETNNYVYA